MRPPADLDVDSRARRRPRMKIVYVVESLEALGRRQGHRRARGGPRARGHDVSIVTRDARHDWLADPGARDRGPARSTRRRFPRPTSTSRRGFRRSSRRERARARRRSSTSARATRRSTRTPPTAGTRSTRRIGRRSRSSSFRRISCRSLEGRYPGPYSRPAAGDSARDYRPSGPEPEAARGGPPTVGVVGPFEAATKGIGVALRAPSEASGAGRRRAPPPRQRAAAQPTRSGRSCAPDALSPRASRVTAMPAWYHGLDLLLHPSFDAEGFPLPPLEALPSGVPVVLTDIPSFAPLPRDAGDLRGAGGRRRDGARGRAAPRRPGSVGRAARPRPRGRADLHARRASSTGSRRSSLRRYRDRESGSRRWPRRARGRTRGRAAGLRSACRAPRGRNPSPEVACRGAHLAARARRGRSFPCRARPPRRRRRGRRARRTPRRRAGGPRRERALRPSGRPRSPTSGRERR